MKTEKGFTIIEMIIVIGIITILAATVVVFVNPSRQLSLARDRKRRNDVYALYGAIEQYAFFNQGMVPEVISSTEADAILVEGYLVPTFLDQIPSDPSCSSESESGYQLKTGTGGKVEVTAPCAENEEIYLNNDF